MRIDPSRSALMARVRQKDTSAEIAVRRAAHACGMRFRVHRRDLPGSPDLVFPGRHLVIFVHGCYWHRHAGCRRSTTPKNNASFWAKKFSENVARDIRNTEQLERSGWNVEIIWECETVGEKVLAARLARLTKQYPLKR